MHPETMKKIDQLKTMVEYALGEFKEAKEVSQKVEKRFEETALEIYLVGKKIDKMEVEVAALEGRVKNL